jgi:o-succinylbenzoate synthase
MSFKYFKYRLPFVTPLQTSNNTFEFREGYILKYADQNFTCYGEAAPLPGFSKESLEDVEKSLDEIRNDIARILHYEKPVESLREIYEQYQLPASLQFGLDTLAHQIEADRVELNLHQYLFDNAKTEVPVNALVSLNSENVTGDVADFVDEGFRTIKCKLGIDFEKEFKKLAEIRSLFPNLKIRLDANQAWSLEEALENCRQLEALQIEFCEEPLKNVTPENYEALDHNTEVPLAMDESIASVEYWPNLLPFTSFIIIKPMVIGNFTTISETKRLANTHYNKTVFTTSLESGIGRIVTATLASGLGNGEIAHGLTTGKLLAKDLLSDAAFFSEGQYHLKKQRLINVNSEQLQKYCLAYED